MIKRFGILLLAFTAFGLAQAQAPQADAWQAGKHYYLIEPAQPSSTPGKIEVTEVFSYACPACNSFQPIASKIKQGLPENAVLTYTPASFNTAESWPTFQRAYLTAKALGVADKAHEAVFQSVWGNGVLSIRDPSSGKVVKREIADAAKFYTDFGIKPEDFIATANSFAINTQVKKADAFIRTTGVESTPTIIVAGKYRVNGQSAGGNDKLVELVHYLVRREATGG